MALSKKKLTIYSLNVWGLPGFLSVKKSARINAIGQLLKQKDYDVVCLQEVWMKKDYLEIKEKCSQTLPYSRFFTNGVVGSGLCIFSKWPIRKSYFLHWSLNGYVHMIHHAEWFSGKGVAVIQISFDGLLMNIYNTHLIAKYDEKDCYNVHRIIQSFDTASYIDLTSSSAHISIVCADFNVTSQSLCYKLMTLIGGLSDAYYAKVTNGKECCGTNGCYTNSFTSGKEKTKDGDRIDYIFYKANNKFEVEVDSYDIPFPKIPFSDLSYSDHEGVEAKFTINATDEQTDQKNNVDITDIVEKAIYWCDLAESEVKKRSITYSLFLVLLLSLIIYVHLRHISFIFTNYFILIPLALYLIFMLTLWYKLEINAIVGTKERLKDLKNNSS